jgi:aminoglycoside N3'-acetyltransferase
VSGSDARAAALLEQLQVPRQQLLYVQASADWIQRAGISANEMLGTLLDWVGDTGTLVMPSYPFHTTHLEYLESGATFDVRRTPSAIGLLPEMFRRTAGSIRSLDPDFCVTARGREAAAIAGTSPAAVDPFGSDSSYQRMLDRHATLVGLGVSLNTNSFVHVIDSRAQSGYPAPVYEDRTFSTTVIDADGRRHTIARKALRPAFQQLTSPSSINAVMNPRSSAFTTAEIAGARFFRWDLEAWSSWCLTHAKHQAVASAWPCWLSRLA